MTTKQQVMEFRLSSKYRCQGEAPELCKQSVEEVMVKDARESLGRETLLEEVLEKRNIYQAMHRVVVNKGAPGIDGMTVKELPEFMKNNWEQQHS